MSCLGEVFASLAGFTGEKTGTEVFPNLTESFSWAQLVSQRWKEEDNPGVTDSSHVVTPPGNSVSKWRSFSVMELNVSKSHNFNISVLCCFQKGEISDVFHPSVHENISGHPFTCTVTFFPSFPAGGSGNRAKKELFLVEVIEGRRYKSPGVFKC